MEGRPPPTGDDGFEWTDPPARPDTGEQGALRPGTGERRAVRPGTGERRAIRGDTGEFERSGRRPPPGRRARRRDLPARVRRRQDAIVVLVVLGLLIGLIVLISGGGSEEKPVALKRLIGQTIVAKLGGKGPDPALLQRIRQGRVGGVIAFPRDGQSLSADIKRLQAAAEDGDNPPLLVMVDQEGGDVKRLPDGPPQSSPQRLGTSGDEGESRDQGQQTAEFLRGLGVNVDLAPVLDVSQPQTDPDIAGRTFGTDPEVVSSVGVAFAEGLQEGGVSATAKHFPGLGRATATTDQRAVAIAATTEQLQGDLAPFKAAVEAGVDMVMVSTASYPTLGVKEPAALSPAIVKGILRDRFGFDGVVISDDLESPAVSGAAGAIAARALKAGNDLLLYATSTRGSDQAFNGLIREVKQGRLDRGAVQSAYDQVTSMKADLPQ